MMFAVVWSQNTLDELADTFITTGEIYDRNT